MKHNLEDMLLMLCHLISMIYKHLKILSVLHGVDEVRLVTNTTEEY